MKKGILSLIMMLSVSFTLTGCDASIKDVQKQAEKMEKVIDEGELFEDDWAVEMEMDYDGYEITTEMKKDGDNYYMMYEEDGEKAEIIAIKSDSKYTIYNVTLKQYTKMDASEFEDAGVVDTSSLYESYEYFLEALNSLEDACDEDGVTCKFEKTLFGKLTIEMEAEGADMTLVLKGGKLLDASVEMEGMDMDYSFDYGNQTVKAPSNKGDYEYVAE